MNANALFCAFCTLPTYLHKKYTRESDWAEEMPTLQFFLFFYIWGTNSHCFSDPSFGPKLHCKAEMSESFQTNKKIMERRQVASRDDVFHPGL
jgi:hypothetical protein